MTLFGGNPFSDLLDTDHLTRDLFRLVVAMVLGGLVGLERQQEGKAAGLRTHMLVAMGAALFALVPLELGADGPPGAVQFDRLSRVMQGIVTGVGFLGAGTILKLSDQREIKGLTTAASIWLTAGVGMAVGAGVVWPAVIGTILALLVLLVLHVGETWVKRLRPKQPKAGPSPRDPGTPPPADV
jgi:putative Mg2+ transporter-C (MgtC) family protein